MHTILRTGIDESQHLTTSEGSLREKYQIRAGSTRPVGSIELPQNPSSSPFSCGEEPKDRVA